MTVRATRSRVVRVADTAPPWLQARAGLPKDLALRARTDGSLLLAAAPGSSPSIALPASLVGEASVRLHGWTVEVPDDPAGSSRLHPGGRVRLGRLALEATTRPARRRCPPCRVDLPDAPPELLGRVVLGRAPGEGLVVPVAAASARHLALEPGLGGVLVEDLGSRNGTLILPGGRAELGLLLRDAGAWIGPRDQVLLPGDGWQLPLRWGR